MQLGFVSAILPEMPLADVLFHAGKLGYDCVEVCCWPAGKAERRYAGITHIDVADFSDADVDEIATLRETTGVRLSGLGYYPNPLSPDEGEAATAADHLMKVISAAARLELSVVNTFIGRNPSLSVNENWSRLTEVWTPILQHALEKNIRVGIENCPMLFSADEWPGGKNIAVSPAIWDRLFESLPFENLGLNYDPSHMIWQQMDPIAPIRNYADRLFHVHAKDVRLDRHKLDRVGILAHPQEYHTPKLPGMGDVPWGPFFSALTDTGYRGPVCVEVEDRAFEGDDSDRLAGLRQSHNYLRNFIPKRSEA